MGALNTKAELRVLGVNFKRLIRVLELQGKGEKRQEEGMMKAPGVITVRCMIKSLLVIS